MGSVAKVPQIQAPFDGSCTSARTDARPALLVGKQLRDDELSTAMNAVGEFATGASSSVRFAVVATASLYTGMVSQHSASRCDVKLRVTSTRPSLPAHRCNEM